MTLPRCWARCRVKLMLENLLYPVQKSFQESKQLSKIKTPCLQTDDGKWKLNTDCRFFTDDIPYGLLIAKWIAIQLDVGTPFIDEVIEWAQDLRGEKFIKDGKVELWVETAANSLFGVHTEENPEVESPKRHGWFDAKVEKIRFGIYDDDIWKLYLDARILIGLVKKLDENSVRRHRAILALNNCINMFIRTVSIVVV